MKRYSPEHVAQVARNFAGSKMADAWYLFGADIRRAILDSAVMDEIRVADSVDSAIAPTAAELMEFRGLIESVLAAGVKRHAKAMRVSFKVHDGDVR